MDMHERIQQASDHIESAIERISMEYDINYATLIGILQMHIMSLYEEIKESEEILEEEEDD